MNSILCTTVQTGFVYDRTASGVQEEYIYYNEYYNTTEWGTDWPESEFPIVSIRQFAKLLMNFSSIANSITYFNVVRLFESCVALYFDGLFAGFPFQFPFCRLTALHWLICRSLRTFPNTRTARATKTLAPSACATSLRNAWRMG